METWELSQHSLVDTGKTRKTCVEVAGRRTFRILTSNQQSGNTHIVQQIHIRYNKYTYGSTLSLTSALDVAGGQRHAPAALPPGKTRYPLCRSLGELQGRFGRVRKILPPAGFDLRTVQPVASRYTDCSIPTHFQFYIVRGTFPYHSYQSAGR